MPFFDSLYLSQNQCMMTTPQLKAFLGQCTKINFCFLLLNFVVLLFAAQVFSLHQYFYSGTLQEFKQTLYMGMGIYKLFWIFFNVVPYIALRLMAKED